MRCFQYLAAISLFTVAQANAGVVITITDTGFGDTNGGSLLADVNLSNGTLLGDGNVNGNVNVAGGGNIAPGNSPGTLTVNGDLTIDASTVTIELGGTSRGQFDELVVTGTATFQNGASIDLQFFGSYDLNAVAPGDSFTFLYAGSLTGLLASSIDFSSVGGSSRWSTNIDATSATITAIAIPEPNSMTFLGFVSLMLASVRYCRVRLKTKE